MLIVGVLKRGVPWQYYCITQNTSVLLYAGAAPLPPLIFNPMISACLEIIDGGELNTVWLQVGVSPLKWQCSSSLRLTHLGCLGKWTCSLYWVTNGLQSKICQWKTGIYRGTGTPLRKLRALSIKSCCLKMFPCLVVTVCRISLFWLSGPCPIGWFFSAPNRLCKTWSVWKLCWAAASSASDRRAS